MGEVMRRVLMILRDRCLSWGFTPMECTDTGTAPPAAPAFPSSASTSSPLFMDASSRMLSMWKCTSRCGSAGTTGAEVVAPSSRGLHDTSVRLKLLLFCSGGQKPEGVECIDEPGARMRRFRSCGATASPPLDVESAMPPPPLPWVVPSCYWHRRTVSCPRTRSPSPLPDAQQSLPRPPVRLHLQRGRRSTPVAYNAAKHRVAGERRPPTGYVSLPQQH
mmetsp:Transcript_45555/g.118030  ORF Transcript_45555/g.118030 Transcript_45555/m.118030 type:complete len:219 (-) Transcript_45555:45-701(-)